MTNLFRTKTLDTIAQESNEQGEHALHRALGPVNLVTLGVGAIIGAGIFVLTGAAAAQYAGPSIVVSFILAGVACAFAGLCYAEFASLIPIAGSAYTYAYATLGELFAWIIGWDLILEYAFGASAVAAGWSGYVVSFLQDYGLHLPPQLIATPGTELVLFHNRWEMLTKVLPAIQAAGIDPTSLPHATGVFNLVAFLAIALVTAVLVVGIKESANINSVIVVLKVTIILVFIGIATMFVLKHPDVASKNWTPFIPENAGPFKFGWSGIVRGAGVVFFAYIGFDAVSTAAQEAKDPQRNMPIGILGSLAIATVLYIAVAGLLTAVVPYTSLNVPDPVAVGIDATGVRWGSFLVKAGAIAGLGSVMIVMLLGQSRVFFSMSRDGLLPKWAGAVHPRFRTPYISTVLVGAFVALFAGLIPIGVLGELVSIGTLLAFVIVCAGVWLLRVRRPDLPRPFKTPMVPLVPILGILISLGLMFSLPTLTIRIVDGEPELIVGGTWLRLVIWMAVGLGIYFFYGQRHSNVQARAAQEKVGAPPAAQPNR